MDSKITHNFLTLFSVSSVGYACLLQSIYLMNQYFKKRDVESKKQVEIVLDRMQNQLKHIAQILASLQDLEKIHPLLNLTSEKLDEYIIYAGKEHLCKNIQAWDKIRTQNMNYILVELINNVANMKSLSSMIQDRYETSNKNEESGILFSQWQIDEKWGEVQTILKTLTIISELLKEDGAGYSLTNHFQPFKDSPNSLLPTGRAQLKVIK